MNRLIQLLIVSLFVMPGISGAALNVQITNTASSGGSFAGGIWTPTASPSRINVTDLLNQLNSGNVTVRTNVAGVEDGDITISSTVALDLLTTTSARTLTLNAGDDVIINAGIAQTGGGSANLVNLVLNADTDGSGAGAVTVSGVMNSGGGNISAAGVGFFQGVFSTITTGGGSLTVSSTAGFSINASVSTSGGGFSVTSTSAGTVGNDITTSGGNLIVSAGGNLTVTAGSDLNATGGAGTGQVTARSLGGLVDFSGGISGGFPSGGHVVRGVTGVLFQGGCNVNVAQLDVDVTGTGNIEIRNLSNLTLTQSATFDTQNGDILLVAGANFTTSVSASLAMVARGAAGDVSIADPIVLDDPGATLSLAADADVLVSVALTTTNGAMSLTGKNITASGQLNTNGGNLSISAPAGAVSLPASAGISTAGGTFTSNSASFNIGTFIATSGGSFTATAGGAGTVGNDITTSGGNLTVTCGGNLTVTAGSVMGASGGAGTGVVNARSTGGVFDLQDGISGGFATQILAGGTGLILRASFNVRALDLDVTGTGDIDFRAGATLTVATSATMDTANGDVLLNGTTNFGASGGVSTLTARGAAGDVRVNAGMTVGSGGITLRADNDVVVGATITNNNGGPVTLQSDLDNNSVGVVSTSSTLSTSGGNLTINGATFSLGGAITTSGANFALGTTGGGSFGNDITTSGGNIAVSAGGSISTIAGADLDVSGGAGTGGLSLSSTAGQVTIGGNLRAPGGDVVVSGNTGVVFNGDITAARNVDVDCVTGNIAINATASIVNSGSSIAFDAANSTITTAAGAIITPGASSKLHMQVRTGSNNLTVTMPLNAGTGGLELLSDNNVVINSAVSATGPVTVRGDVNLGGLGAVNATAAITSFGQNIAIQGKGVTLAAVSSGFGSIDILNQGTALNFNGNISCDGSVISVDTTASPVFAAGVTFDLGAGGNAFFITTRGVSLTIPANININNADEIGFNASGAGADMTINRALNFGSVGATLVADDTLTVNASLTGSSPVEFNAENGALTIASGATVSSFNFAAFLGTGITISAPVSVNGGRIIITNDGPSLALNSNLSTGGDDITITSGVAMTFPVAPAAPVWDLNETGVASVTITGGDITIPDNLGINYALRFTLSGRDIVLNRSLGVGVGGIEFLARNQIDINAALNCTGAITLHADSDADASGVLFVSKGIAGTNQPVTLRGSGVAILAKVDTISGEIRIEPGSTGGANIAAALLGPSRIINGTATFTTGSITGNSLTVNTGAAIAFDNAARTISPSTFTQQKPLGETHIRLGGTGAGEFNRVLSDGTFNAGGKLNVQLQPGFTPAAGMSFDILDFAAFTGGFSSYKLPALGVNQIWDTSQLAVTGTLRILTPIQLWRQQNFGTIANSGSAASTADPDGDGTVNAVEYALDMNPNKSGVAGLPLLGKINIAGSDYITLTFTRPLAATDASYRVLIGSTPSPVDEGSYYSITGDIPTTVFTTQVSRSAVGGNETIVVRDNTPVTSATSRFMRLQIQIP